MGIESLLDRSTADRDSVTGRPGKADQLSRFTVYVSSDNRTVIPQGPDGPLGDLIIGTGTIYKARPKGDREQKAIGVFDTIGTITFVDDSSQRRFYFTQYSIDNKYLKRLGKAGLGGAAKGKRSSLFTESIDTLSSSAGVARPPVGSKLNRAITGGNGLFFGASGTGETTFLEDPFYKLKLVVATEL